MEDFEIRNKTIIFVSKRESGKTFLMCDMVKTYHDDFDEIFLISPTEKMNKQFSEVVKPKNIFEEYSEKWVEALINKMTEATISCFDKPEDEKKHVLLILDDIAGDINLHSSKTFKQLFIRCRHCKITVFVSLQYLNLCPPVVRNNADYVFCGQLNRNSQKTLLDEYHSGNISNDDFLKMFRKATINYSFFVINCNSTKEEDDINQLYGSYKVQLK